MTVACPRSWEVEAARHGQLRGSQLAAHREHLAGGCPACADEAARLSALARWLRGAEPPVDEVALKRLRHTTLSRAHTLAIAGQTSRLGRAALWLSAGLGGGTALAVWSLAAAGEHPAQPSKPREPLVMVSVAHPVAPVPNPPLPLKAADSSPLPAGPVARRRRARAAPAPATQQQAAGASEPSASGEDAAYLHVLRLSRSQDVQSLQRAAAYYLARYPRGFRHLEVEQLLPPPPNAP